MKFTPRKCVFFMICALTESSSSLTADFTATGLYFSYVKCHRILIKNHSSKSPNCVDRQVQIRNHTERQMCLNMSEYRKPALKLSKTSYNILNISRNANFRTFYIFVHDTDSHAM